MTNLERANQLRQALDRIEALRVELAKAEAGAAKIARAFADHAARREEATDPAPSPAPPVETKIAPDEAARERKDARNERDRKRREAQRTAAQANGQPAPPPPPGTSCEDLGHAPPWTAEELDAELLHALSGGLSANHKMGWQKLIERGAADREIGAKVAAIWPLGRQFITPRISGGKHGYTIQAGGKSVASFWVGDTRDINREPTLRDAALYRRVRALLEIPTPAEAARLKGDGATPDKLSPPPKFIPRPNSGWDSAELGNAAETLGVGIRLVCECRGCHAVRPISGNPQCPSCGTKNYGPPVYSDGTFILDPDGLFRRDDPEKARKGKAVAK